MVGRPFEDLLGRLASLRHLHKGLREFEAQLEAHLRIPICMPQCGLCCQENTVMVWGMEAELMASFLLGQAGLMDDVLDRCEEWLLDKRGGPISTPEKLAADLPKLLDVAHDVMTGRCPMLMSDQRCAIWEVRPLSCRAFGVTAYPVRCPRPLGFGESLTLRAFHEGGGAWLQEGLNELLLEVSAEEPEATWVGFLPTMLLSRMRAGRFAGLVDSGRVNPVKLVRGNVTSPSILWERQVTDLSLAGDGALQEVVARGIHTGPITINRRPGPIIVAERQQEG